MNDKKAQRPWWGEYDLAAEECAKWEIGPLHVWLERGVSEWRLAHRWNDVDEAATWKLVRETTLPKEDTESERFAVRESGSRVHLRPLPADRGVVARPKTPFRVLPGQETRIFISSPLWIEVGVGEGAAPLRELVTRRLSDTWFGATTRAGELSYALKTSAQTDLDAMPRAAYRLLTPVVIENLGADSLQVERLSLPVPFLSVFSNEEGEAWTEEVHMRRTAEGGLAELDLIEGPPTEAAAAAHLSEPRQIAAKGHLFRAFGSLLGFE